jgi:hypothetical protein
MSSLPEVWLRGPIPGFVPELMPVVHSLLQVREEIDATLSGLSAKQLWARPGGAASIGFHVKHLAGSLDRLLTYARGEGLNPAQREAEGSFRDRLKRQGRSPMLSRGAGRRHSHLHVSVRPATLEAATTLA